jgi:ATP-binding cassette, subfamily B, heavy metal transporter
MNDEEHRPISYSLWNLIRDIWQFLRAYRLRFFAATFFRITGDIAALYPAYALAQIVTFLTKDGLNGVPLTFFWHVVILWFANIVWRSIALFIAKYLNNNLAERTALDAQFASLSHLLRLDIAWHEKENAGNKLKRIQKGGDGFNEIIRIWINNVIEITVNFIGTIFIISRIDPRIGVSLFVFVITYFPLSFFLLRRAEKVSRLVNQKEEDAHGLVFEILNNMRSVKVMGMIPVLRERARIAFNDITTLLRKRIIRFQSRSSALGMYAWTFKIATIVVIAYGIYHHHYEIGLLILFNSYFSDLRSSAEELSDISERLSISKYSIARMIAILHEPIGIDDETGKVPFPRDWKEITVSHLSFSYGGDSVLSDVSFTIRRGERIGIIGLSGAGKSTLFKLLLKEYENYEGEIAYDGISLRDISKEDYANYTAVVLQETEVFNFPLRDNITIASMASSIDLENDELIERAITIAHVKDFLDKLPLGLDTPIGEKGVKLSGGEKQRLGIARAVYKSPQVLFLDEATSHLDLESEEKIRDSLAQFFEEVTAVVIAHRLTTIREMDRILVIEHGSIIESGSFDELYSQKGRFFELWEKQNL